MNSPPELSVELDGRPGCVRQARRATWRFLGSLPQPNGPAALDPEARRDVVLVVSELVGNACRHAPGPCRLTVAVRGPAVDVAVEDTSRELIEVPAPSQSYGLRLVGALTQGVHVVLTVGGKIVYATLPRRPQYGRRAAGSLLWSHDPPGWYAQI